MLDDGVYPSDAPPSLPYPLRIPVLSKVKEAANTRLLKKRLPMPRPLAHPSCLYPCDLTDDEWAYFSPLVPKPARHGRPHRWALPLLVNAIFYDLRTGCAWR
jgi:putative transposase of IS4/5 family DUF4096